jgi:hypothetical protein
MYGVLTIGRLVAGHRGVPLRPGASSDTCPCLGEGERERRETDGVRGEKRTG